MSGATESATWNCEWDIHKWDEDQVAFAIGKLGRDPLMADFVALGVQPAELSYVPGNLLTTAGLGRISSLETGAGGQALVTTSGRLGVGNGTGTAAVADVDLSAAAGSTSRWFNLIDATWPTISGGIITIRSTFASADGNFAWNEFGIDIGAPTVVASAVVSALLLNHKTSIAQGTKVAGQVWTATATITTA